MQPPPPPPLSRINISELKAQITKKVGPERSQRYFNCLNRFFSRKLGKAEFDKLCGLTLGRENLLLHNQLIQSILKNAHHGRVPPPLPEKESVKSVKEVEKRSPKEDGYSQGGPGPSPTQTPLTSPLIWGNGDVLLMSPRKVRSGIRERRFRDRPSPLSRNGKTDHVSHPSVASDEVVGKGVMENGELNSCDLRRPMQHHQGIAEQPKNENEISLLPPAKRPRVKISPPNSVVFVHSKDPTDVENIEDGEEAEQPGPSNSARVPLQAPLGIPFCSASVGGARRALPVASSVGNLPSSVDCGELSDTETLKKRMEQIASTVGLDGVSMDCANFLNNGLDAYLKKLIRSCVELVGPKASQEPLKYPMNKQLPHRSHVNGILPSRHMHIQNSFMVGEVAQVPKVGRPIASRDFRVAMEMNPQQLGEDWPLLLEKICLRSFEE